VDDLKKLDRIRFVKNTVDFLKKNITYKIELTFEEGNRIIQNEKLNRLSNLKIDMPEYYNFEVYELTAGQILFLDKSQNFKSATIYPDLKTLSSDNNTIQEQIYSSDDDEYLMKKLASGDALLDYEPNDHLIYPKYLKDLIINHKLSPIEQMVYVADFFGNLYKSENGYYILVDEVNQKNGAGNKMRILNLRIYDSLEQVRQAQKKYEVFKNKEVTSEHFYQKISDKYGENFPKFVPQLIDTLPTLLNFDKEQLSTDSAGIDLVDEALKWNGTNYELFDTWFPSVLAYYGECYIKNKQEGKWTMYFNKESKVWIPEVKLGNGTSAWDWIDFYKDLYEGPIPLRWTGDWDGTRKEVRSIH
jgi:ribosomal protein S24E